MIVLQRYRGRWDVLRGDGSYVATFKSRKQALWFVEAVRRLT